MSGTITIEINEQGETAVSVKGVAGKSCTDLTAAIEKALGKVESTQKTRDYAAPEQTANQLKARG